MDESAVVSLRRAALLHHLGRVGVANGTWDKPGRLSDGEWERVRLYPYHTERIVGRPAAFEGLAPLAGAVQERLDGSGYHRGVPAAVITTAARGPDAARYRREESSAAPMFDRPPSGTCAEWKARRYR
jgi:HD-GYP domain-containing protein (c-di-GMP phosphodiesterase class II)